MIGTQFFFPSLQQFPLLLAEMEASPVSEACPPSISLPFVDQKVSDVTDQFFSVLRLQHQLSLLNTKIREVAQSILEKEIPELHEASEVCIITTGSDGREEKIGNGSPLEIIVVITDSKNIPETLLEKIDHVVQKHPSVFFAKLETKNLGQDSLITYDYGGDFPTFIPTRGLDATYLAGSKKVFENYRATFFFHLQTMKSHYAQRFRKDFRDKATEALNTGKYQKKYCQVDYTTGCFVYDAQKSRATKYTHLRPVQYTLAHHIIKALRIKQLSTESLQGFPKSTVGRLQWLCDKGCLNMSPKEVDLLIQAYTVALLWYGQAQKQYEKFQTIELHVDPQELAEVTRIIHDFATRETIFK